MGMRSLKEEVAAKPQLLIARKRPCVARVPYSQKSGYLYKIS